MIFRVLKDHTFYDSRGRPDHKRANQLVNLNQKAVVNDLLRSGVIGPEKTHIPEVNGQIAGTKQPVIRVGIWLSTTNFYSGGRIHLYQYAWTLRSLGAEVFLITNANPRWAADYPADFKPTVLIESTDAIPEDLDLIVTDSKTEIGLHALDYKRRHPKIPFVCFNFETPNWVAKFQPDYAKSLDGSQSREAFSQANYLIANSGESRKYLLEWLSDPKPVGNPTECGVLQPAANTTIDPQESWANPTKRPYAVFSARSAKYKNADLAVDCIFSLDIPFDLVCFGSPPVVPNATSMHKLHVMKDFADREKYAVMQGAHMALAPALFEGYGMVPAEAMSVGTPCIAFDLPVLRQEYGNRLTYADWDNPGAFKRAVHDMARAPKQEINKENARADYGMEKMRERIETLKHHAIRKPRVSAMVIAYWGFFPESIESVYPYADEIIVAFGRDGASAQKIDDGSLRLLESVPDPDKKITIENREVWRDKQQMREWCTEHSTGNYMLLLDGDEIWQGLDKWIAAEIKFGSPRWVNFWHSVKHYVHDAGGMRRWGIPTTLPGGVCPHYRWSWWRRSYGWKSHCIPMNYSGDSLHSQHAAEEAANSVPECVIYHMGHLLSAEVMRAKHEFYLKRDGRDAGRIQRMKSWHEWNGEIGNCGDGIIAAVDWQLPEIVQRAYDGMQARRVKP